MATFVLVHGAWTGAFVFREVRGPLQAAGHQVFTPSLTGIGERVHLASPQVCLTTHIADVVNTVTYQQCGNTWYQPQFSGTSTTYVVVNPPK